MRKDSEATAQRMLAYASIGPLAQDAKAADPSGPT